MYFGSGNGFADALQFWIIMGLIGIASSACAILYVIYWLVTNISVSFV